MMMMMMMMMMIMMMMHCDGKQTDDERGIKIIFQ